ncbi:hypothetical protein JOF56_008036 [Kibdelosporangium banguiense]|uniref:Uncharacterized protein n=1 Tax=Kibdelosporangium banguiense TaxID=1365924 RepID=A0ABS4TTB2_9PSEU|nr:hypothetical protein [Kibdelosporangium banguiense]MBP2327651.1 hypothetical protein [Kibdelosporangium banguiense]
MGMDGVTRPDGLLRGTEPGVDLGSGVGVETGAGGSGGWADGSLWPHSSQ